MIKVNQGYVTNPETGATKDIIAQAVSPNNVKDILIGGGLVLLGITYLTVTAFRNGVNKCGEAEMRALMDAGLIKD